MTTYQHIDYSLNEDVAFIRLNHPAALNAISNRMGLESSLDDQLELERQLSPPPTPCSGYRARSP
jgi:hypothetical protein